MTRMIVLGVGALSWVQLPTSSASVEPLDSPQVGPLQQTDLAESSPSSVAAQRPAVRRQVVTSKTVRVPARTVEQWIRSRAVPRGRSVRTSPALPAGVEIIGASAFGVGLSDRDRLTWLEGRSVASPQEVIETVLGAVARRASALTAVFLRSTPAGVISTTLTVELPDLNKLGAEEAGALP